MHGIFPVQDYAAQTRAVRVHGHVTSIRLEAAYWALLEEMARHRGTTLARMVATLRDEALERCGDTVNLSSYLRVSCLHHLMARNWPNRAHMYEP